MRITTKIEGNILGGPLADRIESIPLALQVLRIGLVELGSLVEGAVAVACLVDVVF